MLQALHIAYAKMGTTSPNPAVGAIITKNGTVVSTGGTCPYGSHHAEVMAIKNARESINGSEMYVTLEPCNHTGNTPPCTDAIIKNKIKKVHIAVMDPNPLVAGKGIRRLKEAGIEVNFTKELSPYAVDLIRPFRKYIMRKRPFIIHKNAVTLDGRIATESRDSRWISSAQSRYLVHRLRAKVDAVIIGKNTQNSDDPALSVRFDEFEDSVTSYFRNFNDTLQGRDNFFIHSLIHQDIVDYKQPLRVLVGIPESLKKSDQFLADNNYVIYEKKINLENLKNNNEIKDKINTLNIVDINAHNNIEFVHSIMDDLYDRGIMMALLEGGSMLAGSFFNAGEIDQFMYFIAPKILGNGIPSISGTGSSIISDSLQVKDISTVMIGDNILVSGYKEMYSFEMI